MLKKPWFRIALNFALRDLGIQTIILNPTFRNEVVEMAVTEGMTPIEAAMAIYATVSPRLNPMEKIAAEAVIRKWRVTPDLREAVYQRVLKGEIPNSQTPPLA